MHWATRAAFVAILMGWILWMLLPEAASGHQAQSGWQYPIDCCTDNDCAQIPADYVRFTDQGYEVTIPPGGHPSVVDEPYHVILSYDHSRITPSPDGEYHICIWPYTGLTLCFFPPAQGV